MTPEQRIILFIDTLKDLGIIKFKEDLFRKVNLRRQYYTAVRDGRNRFTTNQIEAIVKEYGLNANWVFGVEEKMFRNTPKSTLLAPKNNEKQNTTT